MATQPYTLETLQQIIHSTLEGDVDYPSTTDDDYLTRTSLINNAILSWESERDTNWNELWIGNYNGGTVVAGDTTYSAPADFKYPGGYVRLVDGDGNSTDIPVITAHEAQTYLENAQVAYFTGNPATGYTLNFRYTPQAGDNYTGRTIYYDYYKFANTLSNTTDEPEMSDPLFIAFSVIAQIFLQRSNFNSYTVYETKAQNSLAQMKMANAMGANWQNIELADTGYGLGV